MPSDSPKSVVLQEAAPSAPPKPRRLSMKRKPRRRGDDDEGDPVVEGSVLIAVGTLAIAFSRRSVTRVRREVRTIKHMWDQSTTVKTLRTTAEAGDPLPATCLVRGTIDAEGGLVPAVTQQIPVLAPLMGAVTQPSSELIELGKLAFDGSVKVPGVTPGVPKGADPTQQWQAGEGERADGEILPEFGRQPITEADASLYSRDGEVRDAGFVFTELLVTRLGCSATKRESKDKDGNVTVTITRKARAARTNVHHHRRVADGLHLVGADGERADIRVPDFDITCHEAPPLFLSVPDAMNEFRAYLKQKMKFVTLLNPDNPFTHLSRFLFFDHRSQTDDGNKFDTSSKAITSGSGSSKSTALAARGAADANAVSVGSGDDGVDTYQYLELDGLAVPTDSGVLDAIGLISPHNWFWQPQGFYDNNIPIRGWAKWGKSEVVDYSTYASRIPVAAQLNARHQEITEMSSSAMRDARDDENGFRVAELGIPRGCEVTVLARPVYSGSHGGSCISLEDPRRDARNDGGGADRFHFRVLKGHSIDNLISHRKNSLLAYAGLGVMGVATVIFGEEMVRDAITVTYSA